MEMLIIHSWCAYGRSTKWIGPHCMMTHTSMTLNVIVRIHSATSQLVIRLSDPTFLFLRSGWPIGMSAGGFRIHPIFNNVPSTSGHGAVLHNYSIQIGMSSRIAMNIDHRMHAKDFIAFHWEILNTITRGTSSVIALYQYSISHVIPIFCFALQFAFATRGWPALRELFHQTIVTRWLSELTISR